MVKPQSVFQSVFVSHSPLLTMSSNEVIVVLTPDLTAHILESSSHQASRHSVLTRRASTSPSW